MKEAHRVHAPTLALGLALLVAGLAEASERAVSIERGTEVPRAWNKDQHLYIKGNVGVSQRKLDDLEQWLDQNAPNWTVVLMNDARGEEFTEAGGRRHRGMDAVEFALGQTLPNKTGFGDLVHPETREPNGAYFLLFLRERKLSYFASEVYDRRNLGEKRWQGNLDSPAIRAMRGGGRVVDAARDTIINIDRQLARKLVAAERERQLAAERARRNKAEAYALISTARKEVAVAQQRAEDLSGELGNPSGDLLQPEVTRWNARLQEANSSYEAGEAAEAGHLARSVRSDVGRYLANLDAHAAAPRLLADFEKKLEETKLFDESLEARTRLEEARTALGEAQDAHARADSSYARSLATARELLGAAEATSNAALRAIERLARARETFARTTAHPRSERALLAVAKTQEAIDDAQQAIDNGEHDIALLLESAESGLSVIKQASTLQKQREERKRAAAITGSSVGGLSLLALGYLGNRRRRDELEDAEQLFESWDRTLKEKLDGLFALMDRTSITVGSLADIEERGYRGETLRLGKQTIRDVDELFIMSSCADEIFEQARELISPAKIPAKLQNFFAASRYRRAIRLLRDEPVRFQAGQQIEHVIKGAPGEWAGLLGNREDYKPFELALPQLIEAFDERAMRALETLDTIEVSWETIPSRLEGLQKSLDEIELAEAELRDAAAHDGLFPLQVVFESLLPAAEDEYEQAVRMSASDPVEALRDPVVKGERMTDDAAALVAISRHARAEQLPSLEESSARLRKSFRKAHWVRERLGTLSNNAEKSAEAAVTNGATAEIDALRRQLEALVATTSRALELETSLTESVLPAISMAEARAEETRRALAPMLGVAAASVLREDALDPSEILSTARQESASTRTFIDRGDIASADSAFGEADRLVEEANRIVDQTEIVQREYSKVEAEASRKLNELTDDLVKVARVVDTLTANYAAAALLMKHSGNEQMATSASDLHAHIREARDSAKEHRHHARQAHSDARLLECADLLDRCSNEMRFARAGCEAIRDHERLLEKVGSNNQESYQALESRRATCEALASEFHTTEKSRAVFTETARRLKDLRLAAAGAGLDDPFDTRDQLETVANDFARVEASVSSDLLLLEEARQSAETARGELELARTLAQKAQSDGIADSQQITAGLAGLAELEPQLDQLQTRLQVAHEDWAQLDELADQIAADSSRFAATLRGELRRAAAAVKALQSAHREAFRVVQWSDWRYGVRIPGRPGARGVGLARGYLKHGDYQSAHRAATDAHREARAALNLAEAQLRRKRRAASQSSSVGSGLFSSGSSFGGGSSFSSGGGSSSGFSSSSFSSGSGTSRSGW